MRGSQPPHPDLFRFPSINEGSICPATVLNAGALGPATRIRQFEWPILRMRNARRSAAAFLSTRVATHQTHSILQDERVKTRNRQRPHPECPFWRKVGQRKDDTSPANSRGLCKVLRATPDRDFEPTRRHESRGHSSWFGALLSRIRLHCPRMSSVRARKHRVVLIRSRGRRRSAPSNIGHEGERGRFV